MIRRWIERVRDKVASRPGRAEGPAKTRDGSSPGPTGPPVEARAAILADATPETPFMARLIERRPLTKVVEDYDEETIHLELDVASEGESAPVFSAWQPGDALGVIPTNCPDAVATVLDALGRTGNEEVPLAGRRGRVPLREALLRYCDIKNLKPELVDAIVTASSAPEEKQRIEAARADPARYRDERELQDLLRDFPSATGTLEPDRLVALLGRIEPRLYSISSSPLTSPNRISLTVAVVRYELLGRKRTGLATTYLADRVRIDDEIPVFVQPNLWFRLPSEDEGKSCIMIGAGCGISAFRGFLQELEERARSKGLASALEQSGGLPHLLFFGCRHETRDFLYADELRTWESKGMLQLFNAFSRDQNHKVYVQHRMIEQGAILWERMNGGHYFYVCGDAQSMGGDVERAMREIIQKHGGMGPQEADTYLMELGNEGRFLKDVWTA